MKVQRNAAAVLGLILAATLPTPSHAQEVVMFSSAKMVNAGPGGPESGLTSGQFNRYLNILGLDDIQSEAANALFDAYVGERRDAATEMRDRMTELKAEAEDLGDWTVMIEELGTITSEHHEKTQALETAFFSDIGLLLTKDQADAWPRLERARRRDKGLRYASVAGASVDLVRVAEKMKVTGADEQLEAYEADIDRILIERNRLKESAGNPGSNLKFDPEAMQAMNEMMAQMRETSIRLRDTNRRHARAIETAIAEDRRPEFRERINMASFPRVYGESHADRVAEAALAFDDLSTQQRDSIRTLAGEYTARRTPIDVRWARAIEDADESGDGEIGFGNMKIQMAFGVDGDDEDESPLAAARTARRDLDRSTIRRIRDLLNDDQKSRLPKRKMDEHSKTSFSTINVIGG